MPGTRKLIVGGLIAAAAAVAGPAGTAGADIHYGPAMDYVLAQACIDGGGVPVYPPGTLGFCKGGQFNGYSILPQR